MSSIDGRATTLFIDMDYELLGLNGFFVQLKSFNLVAMGDDGKVYADEVIYPFNTEFRRHGDIESLDVPSDIRAFVLNNFVDRSVTRLVAPNMHDVLRYFEQNAPVLAKQMLLAERVDIDSLVAVLPDPSSLFSGDYQKGYNDHLDMDDYINIYKYFKQAHISAQNLLKDHV